MGDYKIKINKELLTQFFLSKDPPTLAQQAEVKKVLNVVMIKHFSKYIPQQDDLVQYAYLSLLERRDSFDPALGPAYNYIYTVFRNEIGNKINKFSKEISQDDIISLRNKEIQSDTSELPDELQPYIKYLTGAEDFIKIRLPKKDVLNLILFMRLYQSKRKVKVPTFIEEKKNAVQVLYSLLKEFIDV